MNSIELLQQVLEYIEIHLEDDLSINTIAKVHYVSASHLHRLFATLSSYSLKEYIKKRRLSCAALALVETNEKVMTIALKYGYESYEGFSRAFKRFYNCAPLTFREDNMHIELLPRLYVKRVICKGGAIYMLSMATMDGHVLEEEIGKSSQYVMAADIDHFMQYNEQYGYAGGDKVLAEAARRIETSLEEGMQWHRIGGDEFVIITHTDDLEVVKNVAERIIETGKEAFRLDEAAVYFQMSLGIVRVYQTQEEASGKRKQTMELVSEALCRAKQEGRNTYHIRE